MAIIRLFCVCVAGKIASTLPINVSTPILTIEDGTKLFHLASCHHLKTTYCTVLSVQRCLALFDIANVSASQKIWARNKGCRQIWRNV